MLDTMPCEQEGLVEVVEDIDDNIVVAGGVDFRAGELAIDQDTLLGNTHRGNGTICHFPCVVNIRVLAPNRCCHQAKHQCHRPSPNPTHYFFPYVKKCHFLFFFGFNPFLSASFFYFFLFYFEEDNYSSSSFFFFWTLDLHLLYPIVPTNSMNSIILRSFFNEVVSQPIISFFGAPCMSLTRYALHRSLFDLLSVSSSTV